MLKTSLQTIAWGDPQHHQFDHIFSTAALSGFEGVEIGFRRLGKVSLDQVRLLLDKHQIALSATHIGGNLSDLTQAKNERDALDIVLSYVTALDSKYLIYSGLNVQDEGALAGEIERIRTLSARCADRDLTLLYHNHDWEFRNDRRILNKLQDAEIAGLGFAPDLGWAIKGGQDTAALLDEIGAATKVLHIKDFVSWEDGQNTCHLGDGVVDFLPAWAWLSRQKTSQIWITAEQDNAKDNDLACKVNGAYLANQIVKIGT